MTPPPRVVLEAQEIRVRYGHVEALHGVSMSLHAGQIATVIGANGAGKTTLLSALMGLLPATGRIAFPDTPRAVASTEARVRAGICLVPETRDLFGSMAVEDNLRLGAYVRPKVTAEALGEVYALFPRLAERRKQLANTLSGGERQMLALARGLMSSPTLLMLDEPSLGLSPRLANEMIAAVAALRDRGIAVLLVEQNARAALDVADYAYVLESGTLVLNGPAAEVARDPRVAESYLGSGAAAMD